MSPANPQAADRAWYIVSRWQQYAGEGRANLLRVVAVGVFYGIQLLHFYVFTGAEARERPFHQAATALAVVWSVVALGVLLCLQRQFFPAALKFVSTGCDVVLLTALALIGGRAHSPLVFVYFALLVLAAQRFSLALIWMTTLGCMAGYLVLVGASDPVWFDADHAVPPVQQLMVLASLALTGLFLGQIVRRGQALAVEYAQRRGSAN
jgi:hypothetical protein